MKGGSKGLWGIGGVPRHTTDIQGMLLLGSGEHFADPSLNELGLA